MKKRFLRLAAAFTVTASLLAAACGGDDGDDAADQGKSETGTETSVGSAAVDGATGDSGDAEKEITVAIVANPQMEDIAKLTPELFTPESGIKVNFTFLEEQTLREIVTRDVGAQGDQFDVVMLGMLEAPSFGQAGWLYDLNQWAADDAEYDVDDMFEPVRSALSYDGALYAAPFYAESTFLMYRQDILEEAGIEMPERPTWQEVADIAKQVKTDEMAGICLRGKPGWGDSAYIMMQVVNQFGGAVWTRAEDGGIGAATVDTPEFTEGLQFYVDLISEAGQPDAATASYNECLSVYQDGKAAMWYDATVAAGVLEGDDSPVKGLNGYVAAPVVDHGPSGGMWSWALAIPTNAPDPEAAWEFVRWATSKQYLEQAGENLPGGWAAVPPGTRQSLYENPNYKEAAAAFADATLQAMLEAPVDAPGGQPQPGYPASGFVNVPEWQDIGTRCNEQFSAAIAGRVSVDEAIDACQAIAEEAATS